jgi:hypothetical protein
MQVNLPQPKLPSREQLKRHSLSAILFVLLLATVWENRPTYYYVNRIGDKTATYQYSVCAALHHWGTSELCPANGIANFNAVEFQLYQINKNREEAGFVKKWKFIY